MSVRVSVLAYQMRWLTDWRQDASWVSVSVTVAVAVWTWVAVAVAVETRVWVWRIVMSSVTVWSIVCSTVFVYVTRKQAYQYMHAKV